MPNLFHPGWLNASWFIIILVCLANIYLCIKLHGLAPSWFRMWRLSWGMLLIVNVLLFVRRIVIVAQFSILHPDRFSMNHLDVFITQVLPALINVAMFGFLISVYQGLKDYFEGFKGRGVTRKAEDKERKDKRDAEDVQDRKDLFDKTRNDRD